MRLRRRPAEPSRRQRLSGDDLSPKPAPFAYSGRRSQETFNTGRLIDRDKLKPEQLVRFWVQRFGLIVLLLTLLFSVVNILSLSSSAKVLPLTGGQSSFLRGKTAYEQAGQKILAESVWNRNKITINADDVSRQMMAQFPELDAVTVTVPLIAHRPLIYVQPAQPAIVLISGNGAYVISTSGKALLKADKSAELQQPTLPTVHDQSGLRLNLNQQALSTGDIAFIQTVVAELNAKQIAVSDLILPASTSELDVQPTGQPYLIKFNLQSDTARQQAGTYLATISQLKKQNITPAKYVDVRVNGRAYYQ